MWLPASSNLIVNCLLLKLYTITWLLCAFSLVVHRDLLKDAHRWSWNPRQRTCLSFFIPLKSFNKPFEFLLYETNSLHFSVRVYCNRSQKTSQCVKSHATRLRLVLFVNYRKPRNFWAPESNPQPSDLRWDALTIELPGLRWQREGYDVYWFVRATYVLLSQRVFICL